MKKYLLDSGSANDYVNRHPKLYPVARQRPQAGHALGTATPVLCELWGGAEYSQTRDKNLRRFQRRLPELTEWPLTTIAAREYGRIYAELRRNGITIQQIDLQIAAIALTLGNCTVVTRDSDFRHVVGLKVEDWSV